MIDKKKLEKRAWEEAKFLEQTMSYITQLYDPQTSAYSTIEEAYKDLCLRTLSVESKTMKRAWMIIYQLNRTRFDPRPFFKQNIKIGA